MSTLTRVLAALVTCCALSNRQTAADFVLESSPHAVQAPPPPPVAVVRPSSAGAGGSAGGYVYVGDLNDKEKETVSCSWTSPDGTFFDLSPLSRHGRDKDWSVYWPHSNYALLINVCANTLEVPARCQQVSNTEPGVAFQWLQHPKNIAESKQCYRLGSVETQEFALIDESNPAKGLEVTYSGGQSCSSGQRRRVIIHFLCAQAYASGEPPSFAWEAPTCVYHVVWPTLHACPATRWTFGTVVWALVKFVLLAGIFGAACACARARLAGDGSGWGDPRAAAVNACESCISSASSLLSRLPGGAAGGSISGGAGWSGGGAARSFDDAFPMEASKQTSGGTASGGDSI